MWREFFNVLNSGGSMCLVGFDSRVATPWHVTTLDKMERFGREGEQTQEAAVDNLQWEYNI